LYSIGLNGGLELSHSNLDLEILWSLLFGVCLALFVPIYTYFILGRKFSVENSGAIAAAYGSVCAVTFHRYFFFGVGTDHVWGHMVAVMALMKVPSVIIGIPLMSYFQKTKK